MRAIKLALRSTSGDPSIHFPNLDFQATLGVGSEDTTVLAGTWTGGDDHHRHSLPRDKQAKYDFECTLVVEVVLFVSVATALWGPLAEAGPGRYIAMVVEAVVLIVAEMVVVTAVTFS